MVEKTVTKHAAKLVLILFGVSLMTFLIMSLMPGDPAEMMLAGQHESPSAEKIAALRQELGLDQPLPIRYLKWLKHILMLDFGNSYRTGDPVIGEILNRLPTTVTLAFGTLIFVMISSVSGGIFSAVFQSKLPDKCHRIWTILMVSIPDYWLGLILMLIFALKLRWVPVMGNGSIASYVLPVLTLGLSVSAVEGRVFRASIIEILTCDYVRFAYSKGLSPFKVFVRHVMKPALLPMVTMWGVLLGHLLGGAVIVESVFSLPGLGKLAADAVLSRDMPMIQGTVLTMTAMFVVTSQMIEVIYRVLDPKIAAVNRL